MGHLRVTDHQELSAENVMAEEASKLGWSGMDTTTDTFEPGCGIMEMAPTRGSEAQAGVSLVAKGSHSGRTQAHIRNPAQHLTQYVRSATWSDTTPACARDGKRGPRTPPP
jgi:hypothetical protein